MPIACLAADVGLVDLDRAEHQAVLPIGQGGTDTMTEMPCGFLRDPEIASELGTRDPLQAGRHRADRGDLDPTTQMRTIHDRASLHRKVTAAVMTPVRQGSAVRACGDRHGIAMGAAHAVRPTPCNEPGFCRHFIGRKLIEKPGKCHAFPRASCAG